MEILLISIIITRRKKQILYIIYLMKIMRNYTI